MGFEQVVGEFLVAPVGPVPSWLGRPVDDPPFDLVGQQLGDAARRALGLLGSQGVAPVSTVGVDPPGDGLAVAARSAAMSWRGRRPGPSTRSGGDAVTSDPRSSGTGYRDARAWSEAMGCGSRWCPHVKGLPHVRGWDTVGGFMYQDRTRHVGRWASHAILPTWTPRARKWQYWGMHPANWDSVGVRHTPLPGRCHEIPSLRACVWRSLR